MMNARFFVVLLIVMFLALPNICSAEKPAPLAYGKAQALSEAKPKKPVKIKVHRNAKGEYSWDLTGDDPDEVARADKRLRKAMGLQ